MSNRRTKIVFDKNSRDWVLGVFKKSVDSEGFIVEKDNKKNKVLTPEGQEIKEEDLGVIRKGSQKFISKDLTSLMKLTKGEI